MSTYVPEERDDVNCYVSYMVQEFYVVLAQFPGSRHSHEIERLSGAPCNSYLVPS